ncbi:hypothetical protein QBC33DRAFT_521974 [Phialemonium atrogriseum]|uniref:Uncharacterized protein n=1 Tax=Phialemonium atrogriseum TaxID=1093897 RepID=A0AAJ0CC92_9PEZI|nr:uncharacterized protein QBC33DRAFT_521974 [Phialemonium atrogriseum]KAK1772627.1 hypothetical protein QBC33DRAFT_521974 [Phialemonium atrogriseum]
MCVSLSLRLSPSHCSWFLSITSVSSIPTYGLQKPKLTPHVAQTGVGQCRGLQLRPVGLHRHLTLGLGFGP